MKTVATKLSVNINKVATLRNARGGNLPDLVQVAKDCERFGADGITVHPRPDERHIRYSDVFDLKKIVTTEFNIEGFPTPAFLDLVKKIKPEQCTLVPDSPDVLTSNQGWDAAKEESFLKEIIADLKADGIRVSLFIDPIEKMVEHAARTGADRIELYTGEYANQFGLIDFEKLIAPYFACATKADELNIGVNAGHDLNLKNLKAFRSKIINLQEVSIGHALISDSLYFGLENTINMYKREISL